MVETIPGRVLQVLGSSAGGVARHVSQVVLALTDASFEVRVAGPASVRDVVAPAGSSVRFAPVEISDRPGVGDMASLRTLRALARGADVVHAHGLRAGALAVLATRALRAGPRVVVTLHNLPVGSRAVRGVSRVLEHVVARYADVVLGVSTDLVDLAVRRGARTTARALVPAPPRPAVSRSPEQVREALGVADGAWLLVTVGRLAPQKGLDTLCDAADLLRSSVAAPVVWVVAGDGPLREPVQQEIDARSLPVRLLGHRDDAPDLLAAADVVVSTAVWEGQPLWLQEALGLGAAIVGTDAGGTREVTGEAAVLVPVGDAEAVARSIRAVLADAQTRADLVSRAHARARGLPTVAEVLESLQTVYRGASRQV